MSNYLYDEPHRYRPSAYWDPRQQGLGGMPSDQVVGLAALGLAAFAAYALFFGSKRRKNPSYGQMQWFSDDRPKRRRRARRAVATRKRKASTRRYPRLRKKPRQLRAPARRRRKLLTR